jgi:hypothetical protein
MSDGGVRIEAPPEVAGTLVAPCSFAHPAQAANRSGE